MSFSAFRNFALVVVLVLPWFTASADDLKPRAPVAEGLRTFDELLGEGDSLADKKDYSGALVLYKQAYEKWVADVRGLPFKESVRPKLMDRGDLQKQMIQLVNEDYTDAEFHLMQQWLTAFGMAPAGLDAKKTIIDLHSEEVAGFYNPKNKDMVLIKEPEVQKKGLLGALFGGGGDGFDKAEQKTTLSHELVHALQDQQFDLLKMDGAVEHDDDMILALTALIEGDATVVMLADMQRDTDDPREIIRTPPQMADLLFGTMKAMMPFASGKTMRNAPAIFKESLLFPYHKGTVFVLHQTNSGGWKAVDNAFRDPPTSTEQVLHPEKYRKRDEPVQLEFPDLQPALGDGWKHLGSNVMGEFQTIVLLRGVKGADKAAAGWDGDAYAIYESAEKKPALVWASTWDSATDAKEFFQAYQSVVTKKLGDGAERKETGDKQFVLTKGEAVHHVELRDKDVMAVEGFSAGETAKLVDLAFAAKKSPKKFDITRQPKKKVEKKDKDEG